jgi:hypothetical protein
MITIITFIIILNLSKNVSKVINHWEDPDKHFIFDLLKKHNVDIKDKKLLISGSFINDNDDMDIIKNFDGIKILHITEPIHIFYEKAYQLYMSNTFDMVFGCVENNIKNIKYPLYLSYNFPKDQKTFDKINKFINSTTIYQLLEKQFCSLISKHDKGNTRLLIYNYLKNIEKIVCPSALLNNSSNEELNRLGKINYGKKFIFSICPENFKTPIRGYITEKLYEACMSGCIPIYFGNIEKNSEDFKIFNKNRILFYDPSSEESMIIVYKKIKTMMENKEELLSFYTQDIFMSTAYKTSIGMEQNLVKFFINLS